MPDPDATHDPDRRSWVAAANVPGTDFPIQNLPLGVFGGADGEGRLGAAIGDRVLDLRAAAGLLPRDLGEALAAPDLGVLMGLGRGASARLRAALSDLLREGGPGAAGAAAHLRPMTGLAMRLPARIGDFSDFMASRHHTARLGARRDPANPLPPAFPHLPIAYHGRAGTVRVSGTPVRRPRGQWRHGDGAVRFGPTAALDFELELATWVGAAASDGPVPMARARDHLFGFGLLNDWSVRDVQFFEMNPLGPFLGKSAATTVSPWVVTAEAMAPFAAPRTPPAPGEGGPPPHLDAPADRAAGGLALAMEAWLEPAGGGAPLRLCATDAAHLAWTPAQMLVHQASNGCALRPGDLLGSGTVSGPGDDARACLAEILLTGPVALPDGGARRWLEDGDAVVLRARAARGGFVPIGFGECRGAVLPVAPWPED